MFSDESRFYLSETYGRTHVRLDLMSIIFRSTFAHNIQAPILGFMVCGPSVTTRGHILVFLQGKLNTARYIAQVINAVLLPFLRQQGDMLFQQDMARPHTAAVTQPALRGVQLPGQHDTQISRQLNT